MTNNYDVETKSATTVAE